MLTLLAPSKTMDTTPIRLGVTTTLPHFLSQAQSIVTVIRQAKNLHPVIRASDAIVANTATMYKNWGSATKPSAFMYRGDVYKGFYSNTLNTEDAIWMQENLMILSGLYGLLKPLDEISQYRLEMKAAVSVSASKSLYEFWGDMLAKYADTHSDGIICMLSSEEYARPIRKYSQSRIVTPVFMDHKPNGTIGPVPIYSKMMRGVMGRWIIDHRVSHPDQLVDFDRFGYIYDESRSKPNAPAFVREAMKPLAF